MAEGKFVISAQNKIAEGLNGAKNDLSNFGKETEKVSKSIFDNFTVTFGDIANVISKVASTVGEFFSEYAEQEKAVRTFGAAVSQSAQLTEGASSRLKEYAGAMALKTGADDDAVLSMMSLLATSGRTEAQIRSIIAAAADMSTVTGKDLKTSVEDINKTFAGTSGRMGQFVLGLNDLTAEELAAGKGVDVIAAQYGGLADAMGTSASVALGNLSNTVDDVKAALGESLMPAVQPILEAFVAFLNDPLIPAIKGFAPIVKEVFANVQQFIKDIKPVIDPIFKWFSDWFTVTVGPNIKSLGDILKSTLGVISGILTGDWKKVWDNAKKIVTDVIDIIARAFKPITDTIDKVIGGISKAIEFLKSAGKGKGGPVADSFFDLPVSGFAKGTSGAKKGWAMVGEEGPELVFFNGGEEVVPNHKLYGYAEGTPQAGSLGAFQANILGQFDIGSEISPIISGFVSGISPVFQSLGMFGQMLAGINPVLAVLQPIVEGFMSVIGPAITEVLAPLFNALTQVGQMLGAALLPILDALMPIFSLLANHILTNFAMVMKVLSPIIEVVALVFQMMTPILTLLSKVFVVLMSPVQWLADLFGWLGGVMQTFAWNIAHPFRTRDYEGFSSDAFTGLQGRLDAIDAMGTNSQSLTASYSQSDATATQSANYRTQPITVNIYQQAPVVGSDGMSYVARMIRGEIEMLAYAGA